jgi:gliding motility-associated-like protein
MANLFPGMKKIYLTLSGVLLMLASTSLDAQIFTTNGAVFVVTAGGVFHCNGGITIDNTSQVTNDGTITTTKNSTLPAPGNFQIDNASVVGGDGDYNVEQDWINDATFNGGLSNVTMNGNTQQLITSNNATVTTFNDLTLTGTGSGNNRKKTLQGVDANTGLTGILTINDRELETQIQVFTVLNPASTAVTNNITPGSEGFVSSTGPTGTLARATNTTNMYTFPTGSSVNVTRYRPIDISPTAAAANVYTVRFVNHNSDNDGFLRGTNDGMICTANDTFYHAILRPIGATTADIRMNYIPASDGIWTGMSHWRTTNVMWNDMATVGMGVSGVFTTMNRAAWAFANPGDPYILTDVRPAAPTITCPTICENTSGNLFTAVGDPNATGFVWTAPGSGNIVGGQGTDTVLVDWTTGTGFVSVYSTSATGCNSLADSCAPTVNPAPVALAVDTSAGGNDYVFADLTAGATTWLWDFGDNTTSTAQNPTHSFPTAGTYTVILTVTNANGCLDTLHLIINVTEDFLLPNVFTPNGDGINDEFFVTTSGLNEYKLEIYDRWGVKLFESAEPNVHWDGHTTSGAMCTDGTYYFILTAISPSTDYSTTGFVTLIGSPKQ